MDDRDDPDPTDDLLASLTVATAEMVASPCAASASAKWSSLAGAPATRSSWASCGAAAGRADRRTDELGVPEAAKEALVFAIIGFLTLSGLPATIPSCTGARRPSVLGSITPGQRPRSSPGAPQAKRSPTRLVMRSAPASNSRDETG